MYKKENVPILSNAGFMFRKYTRNQSNTVLLNSQCHAVVIQLEHRIIIILIQK